MGSISRALVAAALLLPFARAPREGALQIESFAAAGGYAAETQSLTLVGTVRNTGQAAVPAGAALRVYALAGLEYLEGDTAPKLPELAPGEAATFRWKLLPQRPEAPLIASLALQMGAGPPQVKVISVPHLASPPPGESAAVAATPSARTTSFGGAIENNHVRALVIDTASGQPLLLLSARTPTGWRRVGITWPLAEAFSAEAGERPWWEAFRMTGARAVSSAAEATLTLEGTIGVRWRAVVRLAMRPNSSVVDVELALTAGRTMRLSGLRLTPLMALSPSPLALTPQPPLPRTGEGEQNPLPQRGRGSAAGRGEGREARGEGQGELLAARPSGPNVVSALHAGDITTGAVRAGEPPVRGWELAPLPDVAGAEYHLLAAEYRAPEVPALILAGAKVEARARLFALAPSGSVQDGLRVALPRAK